ncbi:hypothetical protein [Streptomyces sp. NPDC093094]|uniref:hypothetical protein n=1 Tax=Streptomyces sp. NPDC093094 TaxID=3366026 RepID=UPI00381B0443
MRPTARVPLVLLLAPLLLTACGTERKAGAPAAPASRAELASRSKPLGIAPEHVYAIEAPPGFVLARQSVGVFGGDGFSAAYVDSGSGGGRITLTVDRGTMTAANCPTLPAASSGEPAACERDGDAWYRVSGARREYAVPKEGHVLRLAAEGDVPRDALREAALGAHRPGGDELDALLPETPAATGPLERGDLPPAGDGAPDNSVGAGG